MAGLDQPAASGLRVFANTPDAVARARRYVMERIAGVPGPVADDVAVMVSELASNSVRHAVSEFTVDVERTKERIRVEVTDAGAGSPTLRSPDPREPSGRGLRIVQELAHSFGIREAAGTPGKTVWFVVDLEPPDARPRIDGASGRERSDATHGQPAGVRDREYPFG